jgi:3-oxoadipate enol-lactonase
MMVRELTIDAAGRRVRCLEAGAGWPVLLIHAFPLHASMWHPQLERVPPGWRYIAPDMRGFGPRAMDAAPAETVDDHARDLIALLDALEIDRAAIGGVSMGGYVTFALYRRAPERFTALILADTRASADTDAGKEARRATARLLAELGVGGVVDQMLPKLLGRTSRAARDLENTVRAIALENGPDGVDAAIRSLMTRPDSTPDLPRIGRPTLIVVGEEDDITPVSDAQDMHRQIPRSQLVVIPAAGHLSNLESPAAFSRALTNFLTSNL